MIKNDEYFETMERIGGRGITANMAELTAFAKSVAKIAREDERKKLEGGLNEGSNETTRADHGPGT